MKFERWNLWYCCYKIKECFAFFCFVWLKLPILSRWYHRLPVQYFFFFFIEYFCLCPLKVHTFSMFINAKINKLYIMTHDCEVDRIVIYSIKPNWDDCKPRVHIFWYMKILSRSCAEELYMSWSWHITSRDMLLINRRTAEYHSLLFCCLLILNISQDLCLF